MARSVADAAKLLDVMIGYDPEDPLTASGVGHVPNIGVLREPMGRYSEPQSQDFGKVTAVFNKAMGDLKTAGAILIDPTVIPNLNKLLDTRAEGPTERADAFATFFGRSAHASFRTQEEMISSPDFTIVAR